MPLTLAKMASNTATVSFAYGEDTVNVVYFPSRITEQAFAMLDDIQSSSASSVGQTFKALNDLLCMILKSWDVLEDDNSTMYPLVPDRLAALPIYFRIEVLGKVLSDIRPEAMGPQTTRN